MSKSYTDDEIHEDFKESLWPLWLTTTFTCALVSIYIYWRLINVDSRAKKLLAKFPGPKSYPIVGNAMMLWVPNHKLIDAFLHCLEVYGQTYCFWLCHKPHLIVGDPIGVEKILSSVHHINKSQNYQALEAWLGTGLLTSSGSKWRRRRKLLTPTFHFKILEDFLEVFNEQGSVFVDILSSKCGDGEIDLNLSPLISRWALDVICETAMGKQVNSQTEDDSEYIRAIERYTEILIQRFLLPWLRPAIVWEISLKGRLERKCLKVLHSFTEKVISERKNDRQMENQDLQYDSFSSKQKDDMFAKKKRRLAFLDLLLDAAETDKSLSDLDIREEVDTFMFEGHDTTAASLGWTICLLGQHPEIQRRVQMELDDIFGEQRNRAVSMADASKMKYLEICIKESLRMCPSVPIFARDIHQDIDLGNGLIAPAGICCVIIPAAIHRNPDVFPDPETFNPDRFLPENCIGRNQYAYVPFSAGHRNCIGQKFAMLEMKVLLSELLRAFSFESLDDRKDLKIVPDLILRPKDGLRFRISKRQFH